MMQHTQNGIHLLHQTTKDFLVKEVIRRSLRNPAMALFFYRTIRRQNKALKVRQSWEARGIPVPPIMLTSVTNRCNLRCKGCYAQTLQRSLETEMSANKLRHVIAEADELGISIIILLGGEPLTRPEIPDIIGDFPNVIFLLFTNGLLIDDAMMHKFREQRHVVPIISLEGDKPCTDSRRGQGIYDHLQQTLATMNQQDIFFGTSLTVTRHNFNIVTNRDFIKDLITKGCRLFFFSDYVPVQPGTDELALTEAQQEEEARIVAAFRSEFQRLFVAFPGDEKALGGCLGAGRGLIHVSAGGNVEPCPAVPFSDVNLRDVSLKDALQSEFLKRVREEHGHRDDTDGCAFWKHRDQLVSLMSTPMETRLSEWTTTRKVAHFQV